MSDGLPGRGLALPLGGHLRLSKAATAKVAAAEMGLATAELRELA